MGYFTINAHRNEGVYDEALLDSMPAVYEGRFIRHVRFDEALEIKMDGMKKIGVVMTKDKR